MDERKYHYYLEVNSKAKCDEDKFMLRVTDCCGFFRTLYIGSAAKCSDLSVKAAYGEIDLDDFIPIETACLSYFYDEKGAPLVAMITQDRAVYLGRRESYDGHGNYFKKKNPMIFVSSNDEVFDLIAGCDGPYSLREMKGTGVFPSDELERFAGLSLLMRL